MPRSRYSSFLLQDKMDAAMPSSVDNTKVADMSVTDKTSEKTQDRHTGAAEAPVEVVVSRKRKPDKMETDEDAKRPSFPPISADKLLVRIQYQVRDTRFDIPLDIPLYIFLWNI